MPEVRFHYNEAVAVSANEQMLLNLVRMRFNHTVQFLEPTNVVTSWSITRNASIGGTGNQNAEGGAAPWLSGTVSAGVSATETPTVTYQPLSGEAFVRQLANPVSPDLVLRLIQSGWGADLVLEMTAERLNDLPAPVFSTRADGGDFRAALRALVALQRARQLDVVLLPSGSRIGFDEEADTTKLFDLLGVSTDTGTLRVTTLRGDPKQDQLALRTRSLLSTLFYASHGVEVRENDTTAPDLALPAPAAQPYLRIRSDNSAPGAEAYVRVPYRGRWYWIDDSDLASKRTFSLLSLLFSLMSAPDAAASPVLTVPTGR